MQTVTIGDETVKQETLVPLDDQENPVTLYGGTVTIYDDGSADVQNTHEIVDLGALNWTYDGTQLRFSAIVSGIYQPTVIADRVKDCYCEIYKPSESVDLLNLTDKSWAIAYGYVYIKDTAYTDATTFKQALNGHMFSYKLATPVTYHFSNLEELKVWLGENNFWCDISDDISVKYWNRGFGN